MYWVVNPRWANVLTLMNSRIARTWLMRFNSENRIPIQNKLKILKIYLKYT